MVDVVCFDTQLLHRLRSQQCTNLSDNWSAESLKNNRVLDFQNTVEQHNIYGCAESFDDLHLKYRALEVGLLVELLRYAGLALPRQVCHQVRKSLSGNSRCRAQTNEFVHVLVLPIKDCVQSLLGKEENRLLAPVLELILGAVDLRVKCVSEVAVVIALPFVDPVTFVKCNNERALLLPKQVHRFECLLLETMHKVHDQNGNVAKGRTP